MENFNLDGNYRITLRVINSEIENLKARVTAIEKALAITPDAPAVIAVEDAKTEFATKQEAYEERARLLKLGYPADIFVKKVYRE